MFKEFVVEELVPEETKSGGTVSENIEPQVCEESVVEEFLFEETLSGDLCHII